MRAILNASTVLCLTSLFLSSTSAAAAVNGTTEKTVATESDSTLSLDIHFNNTKPIDAYSLYAGTTMQAQRTILRLMDGPGDAGINRTDFCTNETTTYAFYKPPKTGSVGCVHVHIAPLDPATPLNLQDLQSVITQVRSMAYWKTWTTEATFGISRDAKAIGSGWVKDQPGSNATVAVHDTGAYSHFGGGGGSDGASWPGSHGPSDVGMAGGGGP